MTLLKALRLVVGCAVVVPFAGAADDLSALTTRDEGGEAKAQLDLAYRYRDGKGVEKDQTRAIQP